MKFNYSGNSNSPGIYQILNTHTKRIYIGQAQSFKKRWAGHVSSLRSNKHRNKFMQNDFNKCLAELGNDDFLEFTVVESMVGSTKAERNLREEQEIALHFSKEGRCYNIREKVYGLERFTATTEETRRKHSIKTKKQWEDPETRQKFINSMQGWKHSDEAKEKIRNSVKGRKLSDQVKAGLSDRLKLKWQDPAFVEKAKQYNATKAIPATFVTPEGETVVINNIKAFCREKGFDDKAFYLLKQGRAKSAYGYTQSLLEVPFLSDEGKIAALSQICSIALSVSDDKLTEIVETSKTRLEAMNAQTIIQSQTVPPQA